MSLTIRARLTLWYTAVLSLVLASRPPASYLVYERSRLAEIDEELARAEALVARTARDGARRKALALAEAAHDALEDLELPGRSLAVFDPQGAARPGEWEGLPVGGSARRRRGSAATRCRREPGRSLSSRRATPAEETPYLVGVAESLASLERELAGLRRALLGGVAVRAAAGRWRRLLARPRRPCAPCALMAAEARRHHATARPASG